MVCPECNNEEFESIATNTNLELIWTERSSKPTQKSKTSRTVKISKCTNCGFLKFFINHLSKN